jgi:tRNA(Arg) A34 adenosine deaminase TadA
VDDRAETSEVASAAYKHLSALLTERLCSAEAEARLWAPARLRRAAAIFDGMATPPTPVGAGAGADADAAVDADADPDADAGAEGAVALALASSLSEGTGIGTGAGAGAGADADAAAVEARAAGLAPGAAPPPSAAPTPLQLPLQAPLRFSGLGVAPNARSFVLLLHCALEARDVERGRALLAQLGASGAVAGGEGGLWAVMQPAFLLRLADAGILGAAAVREALTAPRDTPKWFFLKAAAEAMRGDQFGSKHGAVLTRDGRYAAHGRNHRFASARDARVRVMHSEIHAICRLPSPADARGCECWVVELDGQGVGYEEAVPCPMCNKGLIRLGVRRVHFSSHAGVRSEALAHKPALACESLEAAASRRYPEGTADPDAQDAAEAAEDAAEAAAAAAAAGGGGAGAGQGAAEGAGACAGVAAAAAGFDFFRQRRFADPGRGKAAAVAAAAAAAPAT